jgi:hypothetical protein
MMKERARALGGPGGVEMGFKVAVYGRVIGVTWRGGNQDCLGILGQSSWAKRFREGIGTRIGGIDRQSRSVSAMLPLRIRWD